MAGDWYGKLSSEIGGTNWLAVEARWCEVMWGKIEVEDSRGKNLANFDQK